MQNGGCIYLVHMYVGVHECLIVIELCMRKRKEERKEEQNQTFNSVVTFSAKLLIGVWFFDNQPMQIGIDLCNPFN